MSNIIMPISDRYWRVYQLSIETPVRQGAAAKYITEYLQAIGFIQTQISPTLFFERGSNIAGIYNPNPKSQKTLISIDFASSAGQTIVELTMRVNCFANRPLSKDYEFWAAELAGVEEVLAQGYVNPYMSDFAAERALWYNVTVTLTVWMIVMLLTFASLLTILILHSGQI